MCLSVGFVGLCAGEFMLEKVIIQKTYIVQDIVVIDATRFKT